MRIQIEQLCRTVSLYFLLSILLVGCGGGGGGTTGGGGGTGGPTAPTAASPGTTPPVITQTTGSIIIEQVLLRAVPSSVDRQRFTGFDSLGAVRFGPQIVDKAPRIELLDVSTAVTRLQVEFLVDDTVVGLGLLPVSVVSGEATVIVDPPFEHVNTVLESIVVQPAEAMVAKGTTRQFTATGNFSDGTQQDLSNSVTWSSSSPVVGTVSETGLAAGLTPGVSTISANLGNSTGNAELIVTAAEIVSISITPPEPRVAKGTERQFVATATLTDDTTQDVSQSVLWSSSNTAVSTIDNVGLAKALGQGEAVITATLGELSSQATLTVTPAVVTSLQLTPTDQTIAKGTSLQYEVIAAFSDRSTQDVTSQAVWMSNDSAASIGPGGLATAAETGTTTISASFGGSTTETTLTVTPATIMSISVTPQQASIPDGTTLQFTATATLTDNSTQDVTADSSWTAISTATATVDGNGLATALDPGQTNLTATVGQISGQATLTVTPAVVTGLRITPEDATIAKGTTLQYEVIATFSDQSTRDVTEQASWLSSDSAAPIAPGGLATAVETGATTIRATFGGLTEQTSLTVTPATIVSISLAPEMATIADGTTLQFTATATLTDTSTQDVTATSHWTTSSTAIATINGSGLATAADPGEANVAATIGEISGEATLTVTPAVVTSLEITPANASIVNGTTLQYEAMATFSDNSTQEVTGQADWTSSESAASVDSSGLATAAEVGSTIVSATFEGATDMVNLSVTPRVDRLVVYGNRVFREVIVEDGRGIIATQTTHPTPKLIFENGDILELNPDDVEAVSRDTSVARLTTRRPSIIPSPVAFGLGETFVDYSYTYQGTTYTETVPISVTIFRAQVPFLAINPGNTVTLRFDIVRPNGDVIADVANIPGADVEITLLNNGSPTLSGIELVTGQDLGTVEIRSTVRDGTNFFLKIRYFDPVLDRDLEAYTNVFVSDSVVFVP